MKNPVGQAFSFLGLVAHLGRGAGRVSVDAVLGGRFGLPRTVDEIDPAVLSRVMGTTVRTVRVLSRDAGTSSRARLVLTGKDVPDSVFVKVAAQTAATRLMGELGRLGCTEVRFYRQLAPQVVGVPYCYGAAFDAWTGRYLLVLEDLPAEACEFPDTLHPLSADQAGLVVELLADLHATFWNRLPRDGRGPLGWLYTPSGDVTSLLTGSLMHSSIKRLAERTSIPVRDGVFIADNYRAVAALIDTAPHTVMHGDAHPGNMYFHGGKAGLLDWQAVRRGHPSRELAYTLITSLTPEDRRATQRDLLDDYRRALAAAGGPQLDRDELWLRFRQAALYAYAAPLITAGMGGMQVEDIAMEGLRRGVAALEDLETVAALKSSL
ncbi:ecdysteroid 22-kinase family protein [Mycobacterium avium subsp. hominissuis]|uniref:phosphotransferase n=1 Tax=Mycobacterium avium TaxID=1764 RepID=UPI00039220F2|nr:phosphotransferase [Mycobacterium avium]APA78351.1 phosphotransferase [Mycobacterium avium subsp. hominissuis]ETZ48661.1 phosphotransferase enzyme family protein [Mycobacterium avium MAV_120809_2495]ETZ51596.1 phosphotransferase enzyme family protein [Mycobacterium avium MAV_120709_2344]MCA4716835.1 phosphotransferase [Mycobacterium avium subsp. hominissuis]MCA4734927.1 phosphotransferase [Mycobacterium avium subsp. hominissuis]